MSWIAVGGTALGLLRGQQQQKKAQQVEDSSRKLAAETARYSPWTGMTPQAIQYNQNTPFGAILGGGLQGGMAGAQLGGAINAVKTPAPGAGNIWEQMGKTPPTLYNAGQASRFNPYENPTT